jgi:phosphoglycolate phosphatase
MSDRAANRTPAVIFDLDGTLLDTLDDIAGAMNTVLRARGLPPHPAEAYKRIIGEGIGEAVRRAFAAPSPPASPASSSPRPRFPSTPPPFPPTPIAPAPSPPLSDDEIAAVIREYRREYAAVWRLNSRPYPGIPDLLRALEARGIKAAVLSNKSHPFTEAMVRELLPGHPFAAVRGAFPDKPLKPDPTTALDIASALGAAPSSCLFLGDTMIDMQTAVAAGMLPVGALWGFRTEEELRAHGAAAVIAAPLDLLALL